MPIIRRSVEGSILLAVIALLGFSGNETTRSRLAFGFVITEGDIGHPCNDISLWKASKNCHILQDRIRQKMTLRMSGDDNDDDQRSPKMELDNEDNLKALFERAVVLQRSGSTEEALQQYEMIIKAAKSTEQSPKIYAEVFVNMGACELKLHNNPTKAKQYFQNALQYRPIGTAYVNLALLTLKEGSQSTDPQVGLKALTEAKELCEQATALQDDPQSIATSQKLLQDIDNMLGQMKR